MCRGLVYNWCQSTSSLQTIEVWSFGAAIFTKALLALTVYRDLPGRQQCGTYDQIPSSFVREITSHWVLCNFGKIWQKMMGPKLWCMCRFQSFTFKFCSPCSVTGECVMLPICWLYQSHRVHYSNLDSEIEAAGYDRILFLYGRHEIAGQDLTA